MEWVQSGKVTEPSQLYQVYQLVDTIDPVDGVVIRASCIDYQLSIMLFFSSVSIVLLTVLHLHLRQFLFPTNCYLDWFSRKNES